MINSVMKTTPVQPAAPKSVPPAEKPAQPKQQPAAKDIVQLSSASQAALQEATETAVQTAKEARSGDHQAQRLLVKETAKEAAMNPVGKEIV
jgi:hypothetical protein